jgi:hypothetical protein
LYALGSLTIPTGAFVHLRQERRFDDESGQFLGDLRELCLDA